MLLSLYYLIVSEMHLHLNYQHVDSGGFCLIGVHSQTHYWHPHPLKWCNTLVVPEVGLHLMTG